MNLEETKIRLETIINSIRARIDNGESMLTSTYDFLNNLVEIGTGKLRESNLSISIPKKITLDHIIISCDSLVVKYPNNKIIIGIIIQWPDDNHNKLPKELVKFTKSTTELQGDYDAIYNGLTTLMDLHNNPGCEIEINLDRKLIIDQLNRKIKCKNKKIQKKRDLILELIAKFPVPVLFKWKPKNSTTSLKRINYLIQPILKA